jgi:hypothetical protein
MFYHGVQIFSSLMLFYHFPAEQREYGDGIKALRPPETLCLQGRHPGCSQIHSICHWQDEQIETMAAICSSLRIADPAKNLTVGF